MSVARKSHVGRSPADRRRYLETDVGRQLDESTVEIEQADDIESTEYSPQVEERSLPVGRPSRMPGFWEQHGRQVVVGLVIAVATGLIAWVGAMLVSLNREVGELRSTVEGADKEREHMQQDIERVDTERRRDADRVNDRIDRLESSPPKAGRR